MVGIRTCIRAETKYPSTRFYYKNEVSICGKFELCYLHLSEKRKKSVFLVLLAIVLAGLSFVSLSEESEAASSGTCGNDLAWTLDNDGNLLINGTGAMNDYTSTSNYAWKTTVKSVSIGEGVTSIGSYAFSGCSSLVFVDISDSVKSIRESAFRGCTSLASVDISGSVTSIGDEAFSGCSSLASVDISGSVTSIEKDAFVRCPLEFIRFSDSLDNVSSDAFTVDFYASDGETLLEQTADDLAGRCFLLTDGKLVDTAP